MTIKKYYRKCIQFFCLVYKKVKIFSLKIIRTFFFIFVDQDSWSKKEKISKPALLYRSLKYKSAGFGIPFTENEKKLLGLKNAHLGQRAFIIGNGPSLNNCDLRLVKDDVTFAVNNIYLNYAKMGFHPTYYVVEDILLAEDRAEQINSYIGPSLKFFGNYLRYCINDSPDILWLNVITNYENYSGFPHFSRNIARKVWVGGTVTYICMQLAFYMGFKTVYLIGFDHSYKIPSDAEINRMEHQITSQSNDPNHFDPNYFGKGFRWHNPEVARMETAYLHAREVFNSDSRTIYNATKGGNLNVFSRVDYVGLFKPNSDNYG
jgi:hypothetical protein